MTEWLCVNCKYMTLPEDDDRWCDHPTLNYMRNEYVGEGLMIINIQCNTRHDCTGFEPKEKTK